MIQRIGILGGGQLGRMLLQAGYDFNFQFEVLDPDPLAPCAGLAQRFSVGYLTDEAAILEIAARVQVLTIEIERVNAQALQVAQEQYPRLAIYPQPELIALIQDKRLQKQFYQKRGFPTAPFVLTENREEVQRQAHRLPAVHKLAKDGYDGKGVIVLSSPAQIPLAFDAPGVLEDKVTIAKELAVVVCRTASGQIRCFPTVEMVFNPQYNLLDYLFSPAEISTAQDQAAQDLARELAEALGIVGLLAVELFLTETGDLLINEIAPRPHNSGHHSIRACPSSQFEQHLRAITGLPLGETQLHSPAALLNLIGEEGFTGKAKYEGLDQALLIPGVSVHLYGKAITKPGRKMGHLTILAPTIAQLHERVARVRPLVRVISE